MIRNEALETQRLVVRPFEPGDADDLVALFADPLVARYVGDGLALSRDEADLWIVNSRRNVAEHGYGTGAVTSRESGKLIGWAGFARPGDGSEEIIYGFGRAEWGKGLGRELLRGLIAFAQKRKMPELRATVDPANTRSIALLTQEGFRLAERSLGGDVCTDLYVLKTTGPAS